MTTLRCANDNLEGTQLDSGLATSPQHLPSWLFRCRIIHDVIRNEKKKIHDQVRALQGVMMSGVALWTTDIGGYSGGDPKDPLFQVV